MIAANGWGEGEIRELVINEFQLGKMRKFWQWTVVMVAQQCECLKATELYN